MNDHDLEKQLLGLTDALRRPDPTPAWKADILARARREASVIPMKRNLPPRWLMIGWAAAWIAILAMNFTTPQDPAPGNWAQQSEKPIPSSTQDVEITALLAFNQRQKLNLELP